MLSCTCSHSHTHTHTQMAEMHQQCQNRRYSQTTVTMFNCKLDILTTHCNAQQTRTGYFSLYILVERSHFVILYIQAARLSCIFKVILSISSPFSLSKVLPMFFLLHRLVFHSFSVPSLYLTVFTGAFFCVKPLTTDL